MPKPKTYRQLMKCRNKNCPLNKNCKNFDVDGSEIHYFEFRNGKPFCLHFYDGTIKDESGIIDFFNNVIFKTKRK